MEDAPEPAAARNYDGVGAVAKLASSERYTTVMQASFLTLLHSFSANITKDITFIVIYLAHYE